MSAHSVYAPSSAKANMECAGRVALIDALPDFQKNVSGEAALRGTAAHKLIEKCLGEGKETHEFRDWIIEVTDDSAFIRKNNIRPIHNGRVFEVDGDMIDNTDIGVSYVRDRCEELGVGESAVQLESRTNPLPERDDASGTADVTIDAWPELLEVVDYKNGYIIVEVEKVPQLMAYLLGKAIETGFAHEKYRVTVVQPNAAHEDGRVRFFECDKADLIKFQKEYRAALIRCDKARNAKHAPKDHREIDSDWAAEYLKAGDHCFWCDAQPVCPMRRKLAQKQAHMDFDEEPPDVESVSFGSEEAAADILKWEKYFDALFRSANGFALRAMQNGYDVPGFKMVHGRSSRAWRKDLDEKAILKLARKFIRNAAEKIFSKPKLISGPQAEKLVDKRKRKEFGQLLLEKPEGKLTIAPESDPREAVLMSAGDDFDDDFAEESGDDN